MPPLSGLGSVPLRASVPAIVVTTIIFAVVAGHFGMTETGIQFWIYLVIFAAGVFVLRLFDSPVRIFHRFARHGYPGYLPMIVGGIALSLMSMFLVNIQLAVTHLVSPEAAMAFYQQLTDLLGANNNRLGQALYLFVVVVIFAPIVEEFIFRGLLLNRLLQKTSSIFWSILITSILFGLLHPGFLYAFALSIVFCLVAIRTQSLWAPTVLHAVNNALGLVLWLLIPVEDLQQDRGAFDYGASVVELGVVFALGMLGLFWFFRVPWPKMDYQPPRPRLTPESS